MAAIQDLSRRKARLYAVACCRRIWLLLADERCRRAVQVAEEFADGLATVKALQRARSAAQAAAAAATGRVLHAAAWATVWAAAPGASIRTLAPTAAKSAAQAATWAAGATGKLALQSEEDAQQLLFHDLLRGPSAVFDAAWLRWGEGGLVKLAQTIYDERSFDRIPELADALEHAGCHDYFILSHCRGPGSHVRGCWVIDLLLNKE